MSKKKLGINKDGTKRKSNLPAECLGQFKNPEVLAKANATRVRNLAEKRAKKDAVKNGFERSMASDPDAQAALIDKLWKWALDDDTDMAKFAMKQLNDMGVIKQAPEKAVEESTAKPRDPSKSIAFLKRSAGNGTE